MKSATSKDFTYPKELKLTSILYKDMEQPHMCYSYFILLQCWHRLRTFLVLRAAVNPEVTTFTKRNETIAMTSAFEMGKQSKLFIPKGPFADIMTKTRIEDIVPSKNTHYKRNYGEATDHIFNFLRGFCEVLQHFTFLQYLDNTKFCPLDKDKFLDDMKKIKGGEKIKKDALVGYMLEFVNKANDPSFATATSRKAKGDSHTSKKYRANKVLSIENGSIDIDIDMLQFHLIFKARSDKDGQILKSFSETLVGSNKSYEIATTATKLANDMYVGALELLKLIHKETVSETVSSSESGMSETAVSRENYYFGLHVQKYLANGVLLYLEDEFKGSNGSNGLKTLKGSGGEITAKCKDQKKILKKVTDVIKHWDASDTLKKELSSMFLRRWKLVFSKEWGKDLDSIHSMTKSNTDQEETIKTILKDSICIICEEHQSKKEANVHNGDGSGNGNGNRRKRRKLKNGTKEIKNGDDNHDKDDGKADEVDEEDDDNDKADKADEEGKADEEDTDKEEGDDDRVNSPGMSKTNSDIDKKNTNADTGRKTPRTSSTNTEKGGEEVITLSSGSEDEDEDKSHGRIPFQKLLKIAQNMANDSKHGTRQDIETVLMRTFGALTGNFCHQNGSIAITFTGEEFVTTESMSGSVSKESVAVVEGDSHKDNSNQQKERSPDAGLKNVEGNSHQNDESTQQDTDVNKSISQSGTDGQVSSGGKQPTAKSSPNSSPDTKIHNRRSKRKKTDEMKNNNEGDSTMSRMLKAYSPTKKPKLSARQLVFEHRLK